MKLDLFYTIDLINEEYWTAVYIGENEKKLRKLLDKHFKGAEAGELDKNKFKGKTFYNEECVPFIWVNTSQIKDIQELVEVLAHEAVHCIDLTFKYASIKDDEVFALLVGAIIRKFNNLYKNMKKKVAKGGVKKMMAKEKQSASVKVGKKASNKKHLKK